MSWVNDRSNSKRKLKAANVQCMETCKGREKAEVSGNCCSSPGFQESRDLISYKKGIFLEDKLHQSTASVPKNQLN